MVPSVISRPPIIQRSSFQISLLAIAMVIVFILQLPVPHNDDLVFLSVKTGIVQAGDIAQTFSRIWWPYSPPLFQPPVYSWIIFAWSNLFGASTVSFSIFFAMAVGIFGSAWAVLLRRLSITALFPWILGISAYVTATAFGGYRPDAMAMALATAGWASLLGPTVLGRAVGFFLLGIAVITGPSAAACIAGPTVILTWQRIRTSGSLVSELPAIVLGVASATLILGLTINFDYLGLLSQMLEHGGQVGRRVTSLQSLGGVHAIMVLICLVGYGMVIALHRQQRLIPFSFANAEFSSLNGSLEGSSISLLSGFLFGLVLTCIYHIQFLSFFTFLFITLGLIVHLIVVCLPGRIAQIARTAFCVLLVVQLVPWAGFIILSDRPAQDDVERVRYAVESERQAGRTVLIDPIASRMVYGSDPPPSFIDWTFSRPFPGNMPVNPSGICSGNEVWLVSPWYLRRSMPSARVAPGDPAEASFFRRPNRSNRWGYPSRMWDVVLLVCGDDRGPIVREATQPGIGVSFVADSR